MRLLANRDGQSSTGDFRVIHDIINSGQRTVFDDNRRLQEVLVRPVKRPNGIVSDVFDQGLAIAANVSLDCARFPLRSPVTDEM